MRVSEVKGVKVYDLSSGKSVLEFLEQAQHSGAKLKKLQDYRNRIELIQDFQFPGHSQRLKATRDGRYIHAIGSYPPALKIFETSELSLKCERRTDSAAVQLVPLSDDYAKLAMLCEDRHVELHAQYGFHYKTRIPRAGRDLAYNPHSAELLAAGSSSEIYRLNLERGQFMASFETQAPAINALVYNEQLGLLAAGGEEGVVELWSARDRSALLRLPLLHNPPFMAHYSRVQDVTALCFSRDSLSLALGDSAGQIKVYDLRYPVPMQQLAHQYGLPILKLHYPASGGSGSGSLFLSADRKVLKVHRDYQLFCPFEPPVEMADFELIEHSGLVLTASDGPKMGAFFIPALGPPPSGACS